MNNLNYNILIEKNSIKNMKKLLFIAACIFLISACSKKEAYDPYGPQGDKGSVTLSLSQSGTFTIPVRSQSPQTKADGTVDVSDFYVKIKQGETVIKSYEKYSEAPTAIEVEPGTYTIEAGTSANKDAAFDQPIYSGSKDFTVEAGKIASVNLVCALSNMKVTISCSEAFNREIRDDYVFVVTNQKGFLEYTKSIIDAGTSGYFSVNPLTITLQAYKNDGTELIHTVAISEVAAKDHHILRFDAQETGEIELGGNGITVDYTVNNREQEIIIPGEDEDPVGDEVPSITGSGISAPLSVTVDEAAAAGFKVEALVKTFSEKTISTLNVRIESASDIQTAIPGLGTEFDIANPQAAQATVLNTLGILPTGTDIKTLNTYTFSVGGIVSALGAGTHKFHITATDSDAKTTTATMTVTVTAPAANEYLPTIEGPAVGIETRLKQSEAGSAVIDVLISALNGKTINSVVVKIDSPALTDEFMQGTDLGGAEFSITDFTDSDADQKRKQGLIDLGLIPADEPIKGKTSHTFSIGRFIPLLFMAAQEGQVNKFIVTVTDSDNKTTTATVTIIKIAE